MRTPVHEEAPAAPDAPARVVALRGGARWLVTLIARLVSEDTATGVERARLVLRFECLTEPREPTRLQTVPAHTFDELSDAMLRAVIASGGGFRAARKP